MQLLMRFGGVMFNVLSSFAVARGFQPQTGQAKNY